MLKIENLTFRIEGRALFEQASATIETGSRTGFVGRNGTGKTTLFKLISEEFEPESGAIEVPRNLKIGQVAQEAPATDEKLIDVVLKADHERTQLLEEAETAKDPERIGEIHARLGDIGAHSAEARAAAILSGLGFDEKAQHLPCSKFSGGWRMRVALAAILFAEPDFLLLDEPTNYLDLEGVLWLQNHLVNYPHTAIIISHDRDLLNKICNSILHLENKKLASYRGNYDVFERTKAEKLALEQKMQAKQQQKREHMERFVERFRAKASKARQAQSRLKALEKMGQSAVQINEQILPFHFPSPERLAASPIINMEKVSVGYGENAPVLKNLSLRIDADDRIALLGANGNGKSTFAKLISGRLEAVSGSLTRASKLKIAIFTQHQLDDLVPDQNAIEHLQARLPDLETSKIRAKIAAMGLGSEKMETAAKKLSGGEKARLLLGLITLDAPDLLILDEPTNHLDIDAREQLATALNDYQGAVIVISHDRYLIEACAERLWLVDGGTVKPYEDDLENYRKLIIKSNKKDPHQHIKQEDKSDLQNAQGEISTKEKRQIAAQKRAELAPLKRHIEKIEKEMAALETRIADFDAQMIKPEIIADSAKMIALSKERGEAQKTKERFESEWLELSEDYEAKSGN